MARKKCSPIVILLTGIEEDEVEEIVNATFFGESALITQAPVQPQSRIGHK